MTTTSCPSVNRALALACVVFVRLLQPLSAALINQCPASGGPASCTKTITEAVDQEDLDKAMEIEEAGVPDMDVNLLQVRLDKIEELDSDGQSELYNANINTFETEPLPLNEVPAAFDCKTYPKMCEAPFNCHKVANTSQTPHWITGSATSGIAKNGPNFQSWCFVPQYENYVHQCLVKKDLVQAALLQYDMTKAGAFGPDVYELDGSYCFVEGHCLNSRVTKSTTAEEARQMCDERYGRSRWANFGSSSSPDVLRQPINTSNGFDAQEKTAPFLVAACAMGNYHCDIMYCKETHCKDPYLVNKYGHFLKDLGWTESTASWMNALPTYNRQSLRGRQQLM